MIDQGDYQLAWEVYLGCGALAIVLWVFVVRRLPYAFLRYWLSLAAVAFLFTPVRHPAAPDLWVPGNVAGVLGLMTESLDVAMPVLLTLAMGQIVALVLAISLLLWLGNDKKSAAQNPATVSDSAVAAGPDVKKPTGKVSKRATASRREPSLGIETNSGD